MTIEEMLAALSKKTNHQVNVAYNPHLGLGMTTHRYLTEQKVVLINNPHLPMDIIQKILDTNQLVECVVQYRKMFVFGAYGYSLENVLERMMWLVDSMDQEAK